MSAQPITTGVEPALRPEPVQERSRGRTPLSIVTSPSTRRRAPFVIACLLLIAAVVSAVMVLNVHTSSTQYKLEAMKRQAQDLSQANEALSAQRDFAAAPQNLAKRAKDLGMVTPGQPATIDLAGGNVSGEAVAAGAAQAQAEGKKAPSLALPVAPEGESATQAGGADAAATPVESAGTEEAPAGGATKQVPQQKESASGRPPKEGQAPAKQAKDASGSKAKKPEGGSASRSKPKDGGSIQAPSVG